ncbi:MAG: cytochrome c biogenesis protein CcsA [Planctomycetales bacterium]|nr:cytochrome c biogenesis protein CcsA [Planctomycetales bacterium]
MASYDASMNDSAPRRRAKQSDPLVDLIAPIASLKLTIVLFALSIFLVLAGTLAQTRMDIWDVVHQYFRTWIAWIDVKVFFPPAWFGDFAENNTWKFPFPGGMLIGVVMFFNLLAAHGLKFKIQAKGGRLAVGLALIGVGAIVTYLVILGGLNQDGVENTAIFEWSTVWELTKASLVVTAIAGAWAISRQKQEQQIERYSLLAFCGAVIVLAGWLYSQGDEAAIGTSSMRILWQLMQGTVAGLILLAGCVLVFKKRAGVVLLHAGVMLLMFNELLVGKSAEEGQMQIAEGETVNYVEDIREIELAFIDNSDAQEDRVVAIPQAMLQDTGAKISDDSLPVDVEIVQFLKNSSLRQLTPGDENLATAGVGLKWLAVPAAAATGTDMDSGVDSSSVYVQFTPKGEDGKPETHLLAQQIARASLAEKITIDGTTWDVYLRFKRSYKPYSLHLVDVRQDNYLGTSTPMNYSSELQLYDAQHKSTRMVKIWMNNPLRFAGETFYQSNYFADPNTGKEVTGLQVVKNTGWMIPYVSCMIVAVGMLAQFGIVLIRFLGRRSSRAMAAVGQSVRNRREQTAAAPARHPLAIWLPVLVVSACALLVAWKASPSAVDENEMNLTAFGELPLVYQGRVKPFDTLARNTLRILSGKETFKDVNGKRQPAIRWLLDVLASKQDVAEHEVFRIENFEVQEILKLQRRSGFRYALKEFQPHVSEFEKQVREARAEDQKNLSTFQRKLIALDNRFRLFTLLAASFNPPAVPPLPTQEEFDKDRNAAQQKMMALMQVLVEEPKRLEAMEPPLAVPVPNDGKPWQPYSSAWTRSFAQSRIMGKDPNPITVAFTNILVAYEKDDVDAFNASVSTYREMLADEPPEDLVLSKVEFEAFFNRFEPFFLCSVLYLVAFLLAVFSWLGWQRSLGATAFWMIVGLFVLHSFALVARMYISGRPPVTNLYSSAVFIGWGGVLLGIVLELFSRIGIGSALAAVTGFMTLLIAHFLSLDGDTFTVLQAVLDTQFWLATHVVCITFGYAATFVAGVLGIFYILGGLLTPVLKVEAGQARQQVGKLLSSMIYGILCFAIFFSFVGTVLGGLWADDSWGRFWGWDPKENGALIIVIWNALVLHARWDALVKQRGLAVLAVAGNICTCWSWFGVNELGVGLHSYGFTEGVLLSLAIAVGVHLAIIGAGCLPLTSWMSFRREEEAETADIVAETAAV